MTKYESLLQFHTKPLLGLTENVEGIGYLTSGVILVKRYIAGVSDQRLMLIQIPSGFFGYKAIFLGLLDFPFKTIESLNIFELLSLKFITVRLESGGQYRYHLNMRSQVVRDQQNFYEILKENYLRFQSGGQLG